MKLENENLRSNYNKLISEFNKLLEHRNNSL